MHTSNERTSMGVSRIKARCRLYIFLVIIVSNYYLYIMSSGADSFDEADSYVDKLQNKMSSCPLVKLRGLANRRKKTRKLTLIEACIWLSMMAFNQLLRSLIAHITALLLRAGDVELNPGPPPLTSSTPSDGSEAAASLPNDPEASNTLSNSELEPETTPLPRYQVKAQQATFSQDLRVPTKREVVAPAVQLSPQVVTPEPRHFLAKTDEVPRDDLDNVMHPAPQHSDDLRYLCDFGELDQMSPWEFEEMHSEQIAKTRGFVTISELACGQEPGYTSRCSSYEVICDWDDNSWIKFIISANRLLRVGVDCQFCPMCFKKKPYKIESHVFPRGLLNVYKQIHCSNRKGQFEDCIYDFSRGIRMGPRRVCYPILCDKCERLCDERSLKKLYIFLMANPDKDSFRVPSDDLWLQRALANIMFRGLLIADNLPEEFQDDNFKQKFKDLREYCKMDKPMALPDFRLFLLPNQSIDKDFIAFIYPFEYILRSPMFSMVIRDEENGISFVYTKFDCFHLVLPLDRRSDDYFNHFRVGLEPYERGGHRFIDLRWTLHGPGIYEREYNKATKAVKYSISEEIKHSIFPDILLKISLDLYRKYLSMIYSHSKKSDLAAHCTIMIEFLPGIGHEYPTKDFFGATAKGMPEMSKQPGGDVLFRKSLPEAELSTMIARAAEISPFGLQQIKIEEYSAEIKQTKEELTKKSKQLKDKEEELEIMKAVVKNFTKAIDSAESYRSREQTKHKRSKSLEIYPVHHEQSVGDELIGYQQQLVDVHFLLFNEKRELIRCQNENTELKSMSITVEKNLKEVLVKISAGLKELQRHCTIPELCNKLLQRCTDMLNMIRKDLRMIGKRNE